MANKDDLRSLAIDFLMSPNEHDRNGEAANLVDGLFAVARGLAAVADAIRGDKEKAGVKCAADKFETRSKVKIAILKAMGHSPAAARFRSPDLAAMIGVKAGDVRVNLWRLVRDGLVGRDRGGFFLIVDEQED